MVGPLVLNSARPISASAGAAPGPSSEVHPGHPLCVPMGPSAKGTPSCVTCLGRETPKTVLLSPGADSFLGLEMSGGETHLPRGMRAPQR